MKVFVFSGIPGSGKSSLSKAFSNSHNYKRVSKDDEQVNLFEEFGFNSNLEKRILVDKADIIINKIIDASRSNLKCIVIDKYVRDIKFLNSLRQKGDDIYFIYCYADPHIILKRFNSRDKSERPLCMDVKNVYPFVEGVSEIFAPLNLMQVKDSLNAYEKFLKQIKNIKILRLNNSKLSIEDELLMIEDFINDN